MSQEKQPFWHPTVQGAVVGSVIAGLFTVVAALILAGHLPKIHFSGQLPDKVILVGSGTTYNFLRNNSPIIDSVSARPQAYVLQGGTSPGATLFSEAYYHGSQIETIPVLAMASRRLEPIDFSRQGAEKYFEILLARNNIRVSFGCRDSEEYAEVFSGLEEAVVRRGTQGFGLHVRDIAKFISEDRRCRLYVNNPGSATRWILDKTFSNISGEPWAWPRSQGWDLRVSQLEDETEPWIAFGSPDNVGKLGHWTDQRRACSVPILTEKELPLTRGLYLYGRLSKVDIPGGKSGFRPDIRVRHFLLNLLEELRASPGALTTEITAQMAMFGLAKDGSGGQLTEENSNDGCIYGYERSVAKEAVISPAVP